MLYKPQRLISGMKLGLNNPNLYVGVPTKHFKSGHVGVKYNGNVRRIYLKNKVKGLTKTFNDQFGEGTYTLDYFKWRTRTTKPLEEKVDRDEYLKTMSKLRELAAKKGIVKKKVQKNQRSSDEKSNSGKGQDVKFSHQQILQRSFI